MTNRDPNIQEEHRAGRPRDGSDDSTPDIPEESTGRADEVAPSAPRWRKDSGRPTFEVADVVYEPMVVPELPPVEAFMYGEPAPAWRHPGVAGGSTDLLAGEARYCEHHACRCAAAARLAAMGLTREAIEAHSRKVPCMEPST